MHSRAGGADTVFFINYGQIIACFRRNDHPECTACNRCRAGNETCIFPIHIFKVKEGVNYNEEIQL